MSSNSSTGMNLPSSPAVGLPPTPSSWAHSSVSTFGIRYQQPLQDMDFAHTVEALVEGSDMSKLKEGVLLMFLDNKTYLV